MADKNNHIIVGLGGTGGKVLRSFKMRMFEEFPDPQEREKQPIALLYVDSTDEMMGIGRDDFNVMGQDASFVQNEFLNIKSRSITEIIDNIDNYPSLRGIVEDAGAIRNAIGNLGEAAGQKRRAGRLLFAANAKEYCTALKNAFARSHKQSGSSDSKCVYIVAGLSGGTGSGSVLDAIAQARKIWPEAKILVFAMMPERDLPKADIDKGRYYPNGYAALRELNALQAGTLRPHDVSGNGERMELFNPAVKGVANGITIYSNANENGTMVDSFEELPKIVSDYLYARIFQITKERKEMHDILRAFNFENLDGHEYEYDETEPVAEDSYQEMPIVRTKLVGTFGIKRVVYPEFRILKHITYTTGVDVLQQMLYMNWVENVGYTSEEVNKDYKGLYFKKENLERWKMNLDYLTYDKKVLESDEPVETFRDIWNRRVLDWAEDCKQYDCPLTALHKSIDGMFVSDFRGTQKSTAEYFKGKVQARKDIASEIRRGFERELFEMWVTGSISVMELRRISELAYEFVNTELRKELTDAIKENDNQKKETEQLLKAILDDWGNVGLFGLIVKKKNDYYVEYQQNLTELYVIMTKVEAYQFAKQVLTAFDAEMLAMRDEIGEFCTFIVNAIKATKELVTKQRKKNPGIEDMRGAQIEVSEEEGIVHFEEKMRVDKSVIDGMSASLRRDIVGNAPFNGFARLIMGKTQSSIRDSFDRVLSTQIKQIHEELPRTEKRVLGLSILSQLQQKLDSDQKISEFANDILNQSGVFAYLDNNQMTMAVDNNALPELYNNVGLSEIYVSIPKPESKDLEEFAKKLAKAFTDQAPQGRKPPMVFCESTRKNELFIISVCNGVPMRALTWLADYKKRYERLQNTGIANTDRSNRILLHSEGTGEKLPDIFAKSSAEVRKIREEEIRRRREAEETARQNNAAGAGTTLQPPVMPTPPPPPPGRPVVSLLLYVNGVQMGPFDWNACMQQVASGVLTPATLVWENGMPNWAPAGSIPKLQALFAPPPPPVPPVPPAPPVPPTPPVM